MAGRFQKHFATTQRNVILRDQTDDLEFRCATYLAVDLWNAVGALGLNLTWSMARDEGDFALGDFDSSGNPIVVMTQRNVYSTTSIDYAGVQARGLCYTTANNLDHNTEVHIKFCSVCFVNFTTKRNLVAHEIGHGLGFNNASFSSGHNTTESNSIMWPSTSASLTLTSTDVTEFTTGYNHIDAAGTFSPGTPRSSGLSLLQQYNLQNASDVVFCEDCQPHEHPELDAAEDAA